MVIDDVPVVSPESAAAVFQRLGIQNLFKLIQLVTHLRNGRKLGRHLHQRRCEPEAQAQDQCKVGQFHPSAEEERNSTRKRKHTKAWQNAEINCHPRPAGFIPCQREIPVVHHVFPESFVGVSVAVEYLHHFHAVDIFNNGIVHLCTGFIVGVHPAVTDLPCHRHNDAGKRKRSHVQKEQPPVHHRDGCQHHQRDDQVGDPFRDLVGQQEFDRIDIIGEQLPDAAVSDFLDHSQRQLFKPLLQADPQVFQRTVCTMVGKQQTNAVKKHIQQDKQSDQGNPAKHGTEGYRIVLKQWIQDPVKEKIRYHSAKH